jgi:hypothetical protein
MTKCRKCLLAVLAALMLLTAALRLPGLAGKALTNDEAYAWRVTQYPLLDWLERTRYDANPPFYYLVLQGWQELCGSSVWALRGLSTLLAVLTVPLTYAVCIEALRLAADSGSTSDGPSRYGALLSAFLVAVHSSEIVQGCNARMYALGIFLAALSTWLLLKGLRDGRQRWWIGYGLAAAAFALTHYYAFFTLAAQGVFAVGFLLVQLLGPRLRRGLVSDAFARGVGRAPDSSAHGVGLVSDRSAEGVRGRAGGLLYAVVLAGVVFAPWLSSFRGQVADVRDGFWIPEVNVEQVKQVFWPWCTGLPYLGRWETVAWIAVLLVCLGWTLIGRQAAAWLFLLQAALPWGCAIALSVIWRRSIFYDRYLSFAQWALLCYWGAVCARFPGWPARLVLGAFIATSAVAGIDWQVPSGPPAIAQAAEFLRDHARPGDQVWVSGAAEVNRVRYYTTQAALPNLWVRCHVALGQKGHTVHLASLCGEDILESDATQKPPERFWQAGETRGYAAAGTRQVLEATFHDDAGRYSVALYERIGQRP